MYTNVPRLRPEDKKDIRILAAKTQNKKQKKKPSLIHLLKGKQRSHLR